MGFALDGEGAALVEGTVSLGTQLLKQWGAQGGFNPFIGSQGQQSHVNNAHAGGLQLLVCGESLGQEPANSLQGAGDGFRQGHGADG